MFKVDQKLKWTGDALNPGSEVTFVRADSDSSKAWVFMKGFAKAMGADELEPEADVFQVFLADLQA